jgi:hypothetical protein
VVLQVAIAVDGRPNWAACYTENTGPAELWSSIVRYVRLSRCRRPVRGASTAPTTCTATREKPGTCEF